MAQRFVSSTEGGDIRPISRLAFAETSFPQPSCFHCVSWDLCTKELTDLGKLRLRHAMGDDDEWLVRDPMVLSTDPHRVIHRCARNIKEKDDPPDMRIWRWRHTAVLFEHVGIASSSDLGARARPSFSARERIIDPAEKDRLRRKRLRRLARQVAGATEAISA